jgi:hypothetical protein
MKKKIVCTLLLLCLITMLAPPAAAGSSPYADVSAGDWFYPYVSALSRDKVISGYPDGSFRPENAVTCGEALKLILLAAGYGAQDAADSHWADGYLSLAEAEGYLDTGEITDLDAPVSRLQTAQIAASVLSLSDPDGETPFADTSEQQVISLYEVGIVEGSEENGVRLFHPDDSINRAEISAMIFRMTGSELPPEQIQCGVYWVDVLPEVPVNSYDADSFYTEYGRMCYNSEELTTYTGVDVSVHQGEIDWQKVKASGIDFAITRVGYRGYTAGGIYPDDCFAQNIRGALNAGLDVGVYFFSSAITPAEAAEEAEFVLSQIQPMTLPVPSGSSGRPSAYPRHAPGLWTPTRSPPAPTRSAPNSRRRAIRR